MGCIQAQDFAGAKWGLGLRTSATTDEIIEDDFNAGKILRTHILRPTWHFVAPADIRWMLKLTAPRIMAWGKGYYRKLEIDNNVLKRSRTIIEKALRDGQHLTRNELKALLQKGKVNTDDIRLAFLLMDAELNAIICSGPKKGKQFTYISMDRRVPSTKLPDRDEAIATLARRYFISRGPATIHDFAWWSGLTLADAKKGVEFNKELLTKTTVDGQVYWSSDNNVSVQRSKKTIFMLPPFDEYAVAYKDRAAMLPENFQQKPALGLSPAIIVNGQMAATWRRDLTKQEMTIDVSPFASLSKSTAQAIQTRTKAYGKFLNRKIIRLKIH